MKIELIYAQHTVHNPSADVCHLLKIVFDNGSDKGYPTTKYIFNFDEGKWKKLTTKLCKSIKEIYDYYQLNDNNTMLLSQRAIER